MNMTRQKPLSNSLELPCGAMLPNRLSKAAMSERMADSDGLPTAPLVQMYRRWSAGGAGLLVTGNVMVDGDHIAETGNVVLEENTSLDPFREWARATNDTPTWMQLNHPGRQVPRFVSSTPVAPSPVPMEGMFGAFARPRKLTDEEICSIIQKFGRSAELAKRAGFDGVEIHGAHGYLVSQFLSPKTNRRNDKWGGNPEDRWRFLVEIVREVRRRVGRSFPVGVKLNSADFQRGGFGEDESMELVERLEAEGIDLLEVSGGTYESAVMFDEGEPRRESTRRREAFFIDYAERVRERTDLPLMVTGGFRTAAGMRDAVEADALDVVGLARPLALDPGFPENILRGAIESAPEVDLSSGIQKVDRFIQGAWYQAQLRRIAAGKSPDVEMSRLRAACTYVCSDPPDRLDQTATTGARSAA